jgi:hypothetical protein
MSDGPCFIGIAVAKTQLAMAVRPAGERWAVPHDAGGVVTLVERLQALHPPLMGLEASGGLERVATAALATAGLPVGVMHPRQARDSARATGPLAQTEALDARALAHCADVSRPTPRPRPDAQTQARRALWGRRQPLSGMRTAAQHRRAGPRGRLPQDIETPRAGLHARIATLDDALETRLRPARWGANTTTCGRVSRALGRCVPGHCGWHSPRWGRSRGSQSQPWSAWPPSMVPGGPGAFWGRFLKNDGLTASKRWQDIPPWGIVWEIAFIPSPQGGHRCLTTPVSRNGPP